mgnify:CR=1 FL=1
MKSVRDEHVTQNKLSKFSEKLERSKYVLECENKKR